MNPLSREWIDKAEGDYHSALREIRARKYPNYDAACFHDQQCIEKYLKARLQEANIPFGKTHDLSVLLDMLLPVEPLWDTMRNPFRVLSAYAIEYRYPGQSADRETARQAVNICKSWRKMIRMGLGLTS